MSKSKKYQSIPTHLKEDEFNEFVLPNLTVGSRGPSTKVSFYRLFNYILKLMHTGYQWEEIPIEKDGPQYPRKIELSNKVQSNLFPVSTVCGDLLNFFNCFMRISYR